MIIFIVPTVAFSASFRSSPVLQTRFMECSRYGTWSYRRFSASQFCKCFYLFCNSQSRYVILLTSYQQTLSVNNCPTRCDYIQFYYIFCRQLYMFRMISSSIIRSTIQTVITTSGTGRTVFATVLWRGGVVPTPPRQRTVANTVRPVPDVVITVYVCFWWWVEL